MKPLLAATLFSCLLFLAPLAVHADPVAVVTQIGEPTPAYGGAWVWLDATGSTAEGSQGLKYRWTSNAASNPYYYLDKETGEYKKYAESAQVNGRTVLAFLLPGVTTCTLTVTDRETQASNADSIDVTIEGEDPSLWLVVTYRPYAQDLDVKASQIVAGTQALRSTWSNTSYRDALAAAETALDYETFCQIMQFDYFAEGDYNAVVTAYYLEARYRQIQHHGWVAYHVYRANRTRRTWHEGAEAVYDAAQEAADLGSLDFEQGTTMILPVSG